MWPRTGLSTRAWQQIPPVLLPITALWTTQDVDHAAVLRKLAGEPSWCGDPLLHVIDWDGRWWVEDGHHRLRARIMRADHHVWCRVWPPSGG